jgi:hypothetical protein
MHEEEPLPPDLLLIWLEAQIHHGGSFELEGARFVGGTPAVRARFVPPGGMRDPGAPFIEGVSLTLAGAISHVKKHNDMLLKKKPGEGGDGV